MTLLRLAELQQQRVSDVTDRVKRFAAAAWEALPDYRDASIAGFVADVTPVVRAGQETVAVSADAFVSAAAREAGVHATSAYDPAVADYRGVPASDVYQRPATTVYTELASGNSLTAAVQAGGARLASIVASDIAQAANRQTARSIAQSGFVGFMRVLSGSENCALCVVASTQRYHRGDLLPIHPGCDCGVQPLKLWSDPGQVLDQKLLDSTHAQIAARMPHVDVGRDARQLGIGKVDASGLRLSDYSDLIITRSHGELGPTLAWRSHKFTSAQDIAALSK